MLCLLGILQLLWLINVLQREVVCPPSISSKLACKSRFLLLRSLSLMLNLLVSQLLLLAEMQLLKKACFFQHYSHYCLFVSEVSNQTAECH